MRTHFSVRLVWVLFNEEIKMAYPKAKEVVDWDILKGLSLEFLPATEYKPGEQDSQAPTKQKENLALNSSESTTDSSKTLKSSLKNLSSKAIAATLESQLQLTSKGIQQNKKKHFSIQKNHLALNSFQPGKKQGQENLMDPGIEEKNLALNSNQEEVQNKGKKKSNIQPTLNKGKKLVDESEIPSIENLALNSFKVSLQNKGKMQIRMGGQVFEVTTSNRQNKLKSVVDLEIFGKSGWGSGSFNIKVVNCQPKKCSGCPHLYLRYRWYEGKKQKERVIGKVSKGAII